MFKKIIFCFLLFLCSECRAEYVYSGTWVTVKNRKLNGTMDCVLTRVDKEKWKGKFSGVYGGSPFSYSVDWIGKPDRLSGQSRIDGVEYEWTGKITKSVFEGNFKSRRYDGSFNLKTKKE
jgi:hypothetical protein